MYVLQSIALIIFGLIVPLLFGYAVMKRFGGLRGTALLAELLSRSVKILFYLAVVVALPLLVYYSMHSGSVGFRPLWLLHPLVFVCVATLVGACCRIIGRRWERQKRLPGDWIQYRF